MQIAADEEFDAILEDVKELMNKICKLAIDDTVSPRMDLVKDPDAIARLMFSNQKIEKMEDRNAKY